MHAEPAAVADGQLGIALVVLNVLLDQIGLPVPALPTLIVAGAIAAVAPLDAAIRRRFAGMRDSRHRLVSRRTALRQPRHEVAVPHIAQSGLLREPDAAALRTLGAGHASDSPIRARTGDHRAAAGRRHRHAVAALRAAQLRQCAAVGWSRLVAGMLLQSQIAQLLPHMQHVRAGGRSLALALADTWRSNGGSAGASFARCAWHASA